MHIPRPTVYLIMFEGMTYLDNFIPKTIATRFVCAFFYQTQHYLEVVHEVKAHEFSLWVIKKKVKKNYF